MSKKHMSGQQAVFMSIGLGIIVLLLLFPMWQEITWSTEVVKDNKKPSAVTEPAIQEEMENTPVVSEAAVTGVSSSSGTAISIYLNKEGKTLQERIRLPEGYKREPVEGIVTFLREYPVRKINAKVKLFNGQVKADQEDVVTILKLPLERANTQQQTSSAQRVFAEYFWQKEDYTRISFLLSGGARADYIKWREGYRISANGSSWIGGNQPFDSSYKGFQEYLQQVFLKSDAGTVQKESKRISLRDAASGDLLIETGQNSSTVMIVDCCINANGEKAFLLAQGGKPAQQFYVIKNPAHESDPWYYEKEMKKQIETPGHVFRKKDIYRVTY